VAELTDTPPLARGEHQPTTTKFNAAACYAGGPTGPTGPSGLLSGTLAAIPGTCTIGVSLYQATDQPSGLQVYACTATNTWTRVDYASGASNPATCSVPQIFFNTAATAGSNLYLCTSTNTWTQVTGGSGTPGVNHTLETGVTGTHALRDGATSNTLDFWTENLAGNTTFTISGQVSGELIFVKACQDVTGSRTVTWPTGFSVTADISPFPNVCTTEEFHWDASTASFIGAPVDGGSSYVAGQTAPVSTYIAAGHGAPYYDLALDTPASIDHSNVKSFEIVPGSTMSCAGKVCDVNTTLITQKFFGTSAPGSVAGNLPGDTFSDTTNNKDYWCNAPSGTAAPACTSVAVGGWTLLNGGSGCTSAGAINDLQKSNGSGGCIASNVVENGGLLQASSAGQGLTYSADQDANVNSVLATVILRGANISGAGGSSSYGGNVAIRGGNNSGTNTASSAGSLDLFPGISNSATPGQQGLIILSGSYLAGTTVTQFNLQHLSGAMTTADAGAMPTDLIGVAEAIFTASATHTVLVTFEGQIPINASAAVTVGHTVCAGSMIGQVTDSGGTASCTPIQGATAGLVIATSGSWVLPDGGGTFTLSTTLPLVRLSPPTNCSTCAPLASPVFTGTPTAPTQTAGDNSTDLATDAFVQSAVASLNTVSFSATPVFNLSLGIVQTVTLTGNVTSSSFTNGVTGKRYTFIVCQDGTGSHTFSWGAAWHGTMTIGATASECSAQDFAALNATTLYAVAPGVINQ
jgi:hypothetical protein